MATMGGWTGKRVGGWQVVECAMVMEQWDDQSMYPFSFCAVDNFREEKRAEKIKEMRWDM